MHGTSGRGPVTWHAKDLQFTHIRLFPEEHIRNYWQNNGLVLHKEYFLCHPFRHSSIIALRCNIPLKTINIPCSESEAAPMAHLRTPSCMTLSDSFGKLNKLLAIEKVIVTYLLGPRNEYVRSCDNNIAITVTNGSFSESLAPQFILHRAGGYVVLRHTDIAYIQHTASVVLFAVHVSSLCH